MSNIKVDVLPAQLAANTIYIVKDTGVTATDASGQVVINLQSAYYARNFADVNTIEELQQMLNKELSSLKTKYGSPINSEATQPPVVNTPAISTLKDLYKEFQEGYYEFTQGDLSDANNKWIFVKFPKPFSKKPDVFLATIDVEDSTVRFNYHGEVTNEGFKVGTNYAPSLKGVYYYAAVNK